VTVSPTKSPTHLPLCDLLEWDSAFFERRIARYRPARCTAADARRLAAECAERSIDCVYVLIDSADVDSAESLAQLHAMPVDVRITLETRLDSHRRFESPGSVRPFRAADLPSLRAIARKSHTDSRFYADRHFSADQCDQLYETWIERACSGSAEAVLVGNGPAESVAGYITCHKDGTSGRIGLFAVGDGYRGKGIGQSLVSAAFAWFAAMNVHTVSVATQLRNTRGIRVYERCGMLLATAQVWYHYWAIQVDR